MKLFSIALLILFISSYIIADDTQYYSDGDTIFPLTNSKIALIYENLRFKKITDFNNIGLLVDVHFEFYNNYEDDTLQLGFETPPHKVEFDGKDGLEATNTTGIKDFQVIVNGSNVDYEIIINNEIPLVIYKFKAKFKKGKNIIKHSYKFYGTHTLAIADYVYRLSTGNRWSNGQIDRIDISIDFGPDSIFRLPLHLEEYNRKIPWKVNGTGIIDTITNYEDLKHHTGVYSKGYNTVTIIKGTVDASITNLKAFYDLIITDIKGTVPGKDQLFEYYYEIAKKLHDSNNDILAIEFYKRAINFMKTGDIFYDYGNSLSNLKNKLKESIKAYNNAIIYGYTKKYLVYYNLACVYSKMQDINKAYEYLEKAIDNGYKNIKHVEEDDDLINLRNDKYWTTRFEIFKKRK